MATATMSETPSNDQGFAEAHPVLILIAILVLAATLRLVVLDKNPPGLFRDEARKAFSTWSLLTTGKDLTGRSWPLQVKELKAYTTPFYHWFSIPLFSTLGVSVFSTRLLAALAGSLACLFVFLLAKEWISVSAGCWSALLLAISPWHLLFSRWANQGILMTVFIPAAVWLTVRALREAGVKMWIHSVLAALLWALSWNAYEPSRLFAPLLFFAVMGIEGSRSNKSLLRLSGIGALTVIFLLPFLVDIWNNWAETQLRLSALTGKEPLTPLSFSRNYFSHWNPLYLFLLGDQNPRHHVFGMGQLSALEILACLAGIYGLWKLSGSWRGWLIAWLVLAPIPAAITQESLPHALRTLMIIPAISVLGGIGIHFTLQHIPPRHRKLARNGLALGILAQLLLTIFLFFFVYPQKSAMHWEKGFLEAIRTVEIQRREKDICVISGLIEFPEAIVEFATLPDPLEIQAGKPLPGYRFEDTGSLLNPLDFPEATLFLIRPEEIRIPPWWREIQPAPEEKAMAGFWGLYRDERVK